MPALQAVTIIAMATGRAGLYCAMLASLVRSSAELAPACLPAPMLGQHTDAILQELGYSKADIKALRVKKVIA